MSTVAVTAGGSPDDESLLFLPDDVLCCIIEGMSWRNLFRLSFTCRYLRRLCGPFFVQFEAMMGVVPVAAINRGTDAIRERVRDGSMHKLNLNRTGVRDISSLAGCGRLKSLDLASSNQVDDSHVNLIRQKGVEVR